MTDIVTAAPGGGEGAVAPAPASTPADHSVIQSPAGTPERLSISQAARVLSGARRPRQQDGAPADLSSAPPVSAAPEPATTELPADEVGDADPAQAQAPGETTEQHDPADHLPPIEPPRSWTTEEKERFKSLPRETQAYLAEREQERDRELRRRQNEAAEERKATAAERDQAATARQQYEAALPQLLQVLQAQAVGEFADIRTMADVERMAAEDPQRYLRWDAGQKKVAAVVQEAQAAEHRKAQELSQRWRAFSAEQDKLFAEKVPDILDPEKGSKMREAAITALRDHYGFAHDDMTAAWNGERGISLRDHRLQLIIADAVKYREAKAAAAKPVQPAVPPVQRPGVAQPRGAAAAAEIQALTQKLERTGSLRDAAALRAAQLKAARGSASGPARRA